ncbi:MAG: DUF45 domain-containing protein [Alphaproteobacteria bacterium]|nr:DUF45 domain-containing protein [Alphaproteobacteria bacterium]
MPRDQLEPDIEILPLPDGREATLLIRRSVRARRIVLRVRAAEGGIELVLPGRASRRRGLAFARSKAGWMAEQLAALPGPVPFEHGAELPVMGATLTLRHSDDLLAVAWRDGDTLSVGGPPGGMSDRVERWLRELARREIGARARAKAAAIGQTPGRITLRDTQSRWGSCTEGGNLNFSWRLVLTPEPVLDYVVAHEVAHLVEFNHSRRFWRLVGELCAEPEFARKWLRANGPGLHAYGLRRRSLQAL